MRAPSTSTSESRPIPIPLLANKSHAVAFKRRADEELARLLMKLDGDGWINLGLLTSPLKMARYRRYVETSGRGNKTLYRLTESGRTMAAIMKGILT